MDDQVKIVEGEIMTEEKSTDIPDGEIAESQAQDQLEVTAEKENVNLPEDDNWFKRNIVPIATSVQALAAVAGVFVTIGLLVFSNRAWRAANEYNELQRKVIELQAEQTTLQGKIIHLQSKQFVAENQPMVSVLSIGSKPEIKDGTFLLFWQVANHGGGSVENVMNKIVLIGGGLNSQNGHNIIGSITKLQHFDVLPKGVSHYPSLTVKLSEKSEWINQAIEEQNFLIMALETTYEIPKEFTLSSEVETKSIDEVYKWSVPREKFIFAKEDVRKKILEIIPILNPTEEPTYHIVQ